ncbi:hypothetical protein APR03_002914 [Promicromonospora thailandica]|uniref:Helix-turn-helix DNA binding domain protein n=2 Tax=Promicromonospora thailandica TaxID=765201 RepID=A0A9X2G4U4_9MICO|nr:hypothetical protein [Promicromonospora thailandica]
MTSTCVHEWQWLKDQDTGQGPTPYGCAHCSATTHGCCECGRAMDTSLLVCDPCLDRARRVVGDVARWMTEHTYGVNLVSLRAVRYDRDRPAAADDARLPFGLDSIVTDPDDRRIAAAKHPDDAVRWLHSWAAWWAAERQEVVGDDPLGYLLDHTLWAIQNQEASAWETYIDDARQVRATVRRLLGIAPVAEPVPCVHCGGRIVRDWTEDGLDDLRRCTGCGMEWPNEARLLHTNMQVLHALPATDPDTLVTREQVRRIYPQLHPATLRKWIQRGHVVAVSADVRGESMYRLGDVADRMAQPEETKGGSVA